MSLYPDTYFQNKSAEHININIPDESIPLSLKAQELTLEESKTYMRWYSDILARTNSRTISMNDVFNFLNNFKISDLIKNHIKSIFSKIMNSINIGEFFALLRVISHTLLGEEPSRKLIKIEAPVPQPPSILSKKRINEVVKEDKTPLDIDSFTQFLLTGERPSEKRKKLKSVKFSDQIDIHDASNLTPAESPQPIDYSLPMDQLLDRIKKQPSDEEEQEILKDMEPQINHFQHLHNVDTMSVNGVPRNFLQPNMTGPNQMSHLIPNMTGPNQMSTMFSPSPEPAKPLRPNATGPIDMARIFAPDNNNETPKTTLSAFSSQMSGPTQENTLQNSKPPIPRHRSISSPIPNKTPPPPPPPRRRINNNNNEPTPPPLPPKIYSNENNNSTANILDDLKALQEEVDKITSLTNGF
ncbi:unnamed protein product [Candida verbasci]|uniref:Protein SCD5 n=1 Tax=Candida verbasci TaxID=1227364 RepID=A0A9W4TSF2_9ASCO|nr:unnamed protein product [Candida verbasci]